jgi:uncharacterized membrane protein YuzA (DUF378 family)
MKFLNVLALLLILAGAINWGLWGFFQFDFVAWLAKGNTTMLARLVYGVVGLAGVWGLGLLGRCKCGCADAAVDAAVKVNVDLAVDAINADLKVLETLATAAECNQFLSPTNCRVLSFNRLIINREVIIRTRYN